MISGRGSDDDPRRVVGRIHVVVFVVGEVVFVVRGCVTLCIGGAGGGVPVTADRHRRRARRRNRHLGTTTTSARRTAGLAGPVGLSWEEIKSFD